MIKKEYPEPPKKNYKKIREKLYKNFPNLSYYNIPKNVTTKLGKSEIIIGDALDDLTDIILDLKDILWYLDNTSEENAKWYYKNLYESHWGNHLINLQYYLLNKNIEV